MQKYKSYREKKEAQKGGTYEGNSPFFRNITEFQYLKPLHKDMYPHLREWPGFRLPSAPKPWHQQNNREEEEEL